MIFEKVNRDIKTGKMLYYNIKLIKNSFFRMIIMQYSRIKDMAKLDAYKHCLSYLRRVCILDMCRLMHTIFNFHKIVDLGK